MLARPTKENEDEANKRRYRECERSEYACYTACLYHLCNSVFRSVEDEQEEREFGTGKTGSYAAGGLRIEALVMIRAGTNVGSESGWIQEKPGGEEVGSNVFNLCSRIRPSALNVKD